MKIITFVNLVLFWAIINQVNAQDTSLIKKMAYTVTLKKIMLGTENGVEIEKSISKKSTLSLTAGMGLVLLKDNDVYNINGRIALIPMISTSYRYYYNFLQRAKMNKYISDNCASFLIGRFDVFFPNPAEYTNNWMVSQGWGIQRKFAKNVFYNLQLGITENFFKVNSNIEFRLQPLINGSIFIKI